MIEQQLAIDEYELAREDAKAEDAVPIQCLFQPNRAAIAGHGQFMSWREHLRPPQKSPFIRCTAVN